jgi:hypothetical protein
MPGIQETYYKTMILILVFGFQAGGGARLQSWALFAEISGAKSVGEIGAGA